MGDHFKNIVLYLRNLSNPVVVRCKDNRQTGSQANIMRVIKWPFTQSYLLTRRIGLNCDQGIETKSRGEGQKNLCHCTSNCSECQNKHKEQFDVYNMYWTCNSMNNLPSYCGLIDSRMITSDKNLPVEQDTMYPT